MAELKDILANNRRWAAEVVAEVMLPWLAQNAGPEAV